MPALRDLVTMIRDDLARAGSRSGPAARAIRRHHARTCPQRRDHGDWASNVALQLAKGHRRQAPRARKRGSRKASSASIWRSSSGSRSRHRGSSTSSWRRTWLHDVVRDVVARGNDYGRPTRSRASASTSSSSRPTRPGRCTPAVDAGLRSATRSQICSPRRAPRSTASTTSTTRARSSTCSATRFYARYRGESPPEDGYQGQYLVDMAAQLHAERGDDVAPDDACEWGYRARDRRA